MEPGRDARFAVEAIDRPVGLQKGVLNGVLRVVLVAEQTPRRGQHPAAFAVHKRGECVLVAVAERGDQAIVRVVRLRFRRSAAQQLDEEARAALEHRATRAQPVQ